MCAGVAECNAAAAGCWLSAMLQLMVAARADVNARNLCKTSALHIAYQQGNAQMAHLLLKRGIYRDISIYRYTSAAQESYI